jgi:hypothetical protein
MARGADIFRPRRAAFPLDDSDINIGRPFDATAGQRKSRLPRRKVNAKNPWDSDEEERPTKRPPYTPPTWRFPIPRLTKVSNREVIQQLKEKFSISNIINSLRAT